MRKSNPAQSEFRNLSTIEVQGVTLPGRPKGYTDGSSRSVSAASVFNNPTINQDLRNMPKHRKQALRNEELTKTQYIHRQEDTSDGHTCFIHRPEVDNDHLFRTQPISRHTGQIKTIPLHRTIPLARPSYKNTAPTDQTQATSKSEQPVSTRENKSTESSTAVSPIPKEEWPLAWLVVITGPMKGKFFVITSGKNNIGQAKDNSICLIDDPDVSARQNSIHYDAEYAAFYIDKCPSAQQMTKLSDGDTVNSYTPLEHGEILKVSPNTKLRFIPFCGETFNW